MSELTHHDMDGAPVAVGDFLKFEDEGGLYGGKVRLKVLKLLPDNKACVEWDTGEGEIVDVADLTVAES